jgi:hypothetical protein
MIISPVTEIMPDRCTPEYQRVVAKLGALLSCRRAHALLEDFFPIGDPPTIETIRQRTLQLGARLEREAVASPMSASAAEAETITLSIDGYGAKSFFVTESRNFHPKCATPMDHEITRNHAESFGIFRLTIGPPKFAPEPSRCHLSPGRGRCRRGLFAKLAPNFRHHRRMLSYDTMTPRSARISSTSRKLRQNTWYSQTAWQMSSAGKR